MSLDTLNDEIEKIWLSRLPYVINICRVKMQSCPQEIDDVVSEIGLAFVNEVKLNGLPDYPVAWLNKVTYNKIFAKYKEMKKRRTRYAQEDFENSDKPELCQDVLFDDIIISDKKIYDKKEEILEGLSAKDKITYELLYIYKLKQKDAANILGTTVDAIKQRNKRIRQRINKEVDTAFK